MMGRERFNRASHPACDGFAKFAVLRIINLSSARRTSGAPDFFIRKELAILLAGLTSTFFITKKGRFCCLAWPC